MGPDALPGVTIFNPDQQCFRDLENVVGNSLMKTSNASGIPDSIKFYLGKQQECFRFGVSTGCSPTDGCYWDNVSLTIVDGPPIQLSSDIWNWINDTFPANETAGFPGVASKFDTCAAILKTGLNTDRNGLEHDPRRRPGRLGRDHQQPDHHPGGHDLPDPPRSG